MPHVAALSPTPGKSPTPEMAPASGAGAEIRASVERPADDAFDGYRHLLFMRFAILNGLGAAFLAMALAQGWIQLLFAADQTYLVRGLFAIFLAGLAVTALKIKKISASIDDARAERRSGGGWAASHLAKMARAPKEARPALEAALRLRLAQRIAAPKHIAGSLVLLGLIGTVLGFMIALSGVDQEAVANVEAVPAMVATMIDGMSVALHTTLVGSALNLWLMANYRLLEGGATHLLARLLEKGAKA